MLVLRANTDDMELITGSAADIEVHLSAMQADASTPPVVQPLPNLGPLASITTATTTMILDTSGITNGHVVNVKHLNVYNNHATQSCLTTIQVNDGTNITILAEVTLLAGEALVFTQGGVWIHYDANGGVYPSVGNAATQAEMEAGTATDKYVTPQGVNWHPGACKFWCNVTGAGTPALQASWNVTSIADTGVGRMTVTIATDFSSANWSCSISVFTSATSADEGIPNINAKAAGTVEAGNRIITPAAGDPAVGYDVQGFGDQ